jgi:hypothetical protein
MNGSEHAEIWASFSVFDHLSPGAFLADVVMYDRLVVPIPPADDSAEWERWEAEGWNPQRQRRLLEVLGPTAEPVEWTQARRDVWRQHYEQARASAGQYLRQSLAGQVTAAGLFDVIPAMAAPVVATSPYTSLAELMDDLAIARAANPVPLPQSTVSAVVGRELLLPVDESRSEIDVLREAVEVVTSVNDYRNARAALHDRLRRFSRDGVTDAASLQAAVHEIKTASDDLERSVRKRKIWVNAQRVFSFAQIVLGALMTPINPIGIGAVVAGIGQFTVSEKLSDPRAVYRSAPDLAMLIDVRRQLHLSG